MYSMNNIVRHRLLYKKTNQYLTRSYFTYQNSNYTKNQKDLSLKL